MGRLGLSDQFDRCMRTKMLNRLILGKIKRPMHRPLFGVTISFAILLTGCVQKVSKILESQSSPNKDYIAEVVNDELYGPGNNSEIIRVFMGTKSDSDRLLIATFIRDGVDNPTINVRWLDNSHLEIRFSGAKQMFKAVQFNNITIIYK